MPKILVVEDDPITRFMMSEMCEILGHDCETVADGAECIEKLATHPDSFGLILMDIHMPRASGPETSEAIRNFQTDPPRNTPIVAITADVNWHSHRRCTAYGFNSVIAKPVSVTTLSEAVERFIA